MMKSTAALLLLSALLAQAQSQDVDPELLPAIQTLTGDIYTSRHGMQYLESIADVLGPRLTGSQNYEKSVRWAVDRFHDMGISDVRLEPVTLKHGWERGTARARIVGTNPRELHVSAYGWSPPTPGGGLHAPVVMLSGPTDEALSAANVRGAIVLIDRARLVGGVGDQNLTAEDWERQRRFETLGHRLRDAGALATLMFSKAKNQVLGVGDPEWGGELIALPMGAIGREDGLYIARQLAKGPLQIELALDTRVSGPITVNSVVAQLRGRERPEEVVMLGAHFDSWDLATGAQDNGSGAAQVMEAARAIAALPRAPRRSMRFALWASEEQGLNGSTAYVRSHAQEMQHIVAYLNTDGGAGHPLGWTVNGRGDVTTALASLAPLLGRIGGSNLGGEIGFDTDSAPFFLAGVAALDLDVVEDEYIAVVHHKPADTLDKVNVHEFAAGAAMIAATAYAFAEASERPVKRFTWPEVSKILDRIGAARYVTSSPLQGLWGE